MIAYLTPTYLNSYPGSPHIATPWTVVADHRSRRAPGDLGRRPARVLRGRCCHQMANTFLLNAYSSNVHVEARYLLFQAWNTWKE